jgi:hypothetical protein
MRLSRIRLAAVAQVRANWRIRKRLPRLTQLMLEIDGADTCEIVL